MSEISGLAACASAGPHRRRPASPARSRTPLDSSTQMVLVVTPAWDSTSGSLRRFERDTPTGAWRQVGDVEPIVVGRTGVAWDDRSVRAASGEPVKREGDGRSPAGAFALDTAFGFDSRQVVPVGASALRAAARDDGVRRRRAIGALQHDRRPRQRAARGLDELREDAGDRSVRVRCARGVQRAADAVARLVHLPARLGGAASR